MDILKSLSMHRFENEKCIERQRKIFFPGNKIRAIRLIFSHDNRHDVEFQMNMMHGTNSIGLIPGFQDLLAALEFFTQQKESRDEENEENNLFGLENRFHFLYNM